MTERAGLMRSAIEILALQARVFEAQGAPDEALTRLRRALSLAEPEGYIRTFIDEGEPMASLLQAAHSQSIVPDYVNRLLAAFRADAQRRESAARTPAPLHPYAST